MTRVWVALVLLVLSACASSTVTTSRPTTTTEPVTTTTTGPPTTVPAGIEALQALADASVSAEASATFLGVFDSDHTAEIVAGSTGDGDAVDPGMAFEAASVSKMVVATAVMQLVDEGLVALDDPLADYIDVDAPAAITVRSVLSHHSGIPSLTDQLDACPSEETIQRAIEAASLATGPLEEADYSNTNYLLLGQLVASVTGEDIGMLATRRIFEPLGMTSTYWWESMEGPDPYSRAPRDMPAEVGPFSCLPLPSTVGTEGLTFVTSLDDMDRFLRGLFGGALVSDDALQEMYEGALDGNGLGLWAQQHPNADAVVYGHFGARDAFSAVAYFDPGRDRSIVVYTNDPSDAEELMWATWDWAEQRAG